MTLPNKRVRTYGPESVVPSREMRLVESIIADLENRKHRERSKYLWPAHTDRVGTWSYSGLNGYFESTAADDLMALPVELLVGERIRRVVARCDPKDNLVPDIFTVRLYDIDVLSGVRDLVGSTTRGISPAGIVETTIDLTADPEVVEAAHAYTVEVVAGAALDRLYWVRLDYDYPVAV